MIYFDNAATGGFKPYSVLEQTTSAIKYLSANPGRSGHRLSTAGANLIFKTRTTLNSLFNGGGADRVILTKNCTEALNTAIFGVAKKGNVITTSAEHNSTLRPLKKLEADGLITLTILDPTETLAEDIIASVCDDTFLVCVNNVSNVNGHENDVRKIGTNLKEQFPDVIFLVDGAQSAGHQTIDMKGFGIDILCVAGHKGLYGIMGSGALLFTEKVNVKPILYGGTGVESFNPSQPDFYPEMLEAGTLNLPAAVSLLEGALYVKKNTETFGLLLYDMSKTLISALSSFERIKLYSTPNRAGIVAFSVENIPSSEFADILSSNYDIAVRGGFHCAPLMHKFLKTEKDGLVRVSLAPQNTVREIYAFIDAVKKIIAS